MFRGAAVSSSYHLRLSSTQNPKPIATSSSHFPNSGLSLSLLLSHLPFAPLRRSSPRGSAPLAIPSSSSHSAKPYTSRGGSLRPLLSPRPTSTRPSGRVAFSSGNNSIQDKEILVQHLLVGADDLKLLMELQKRIAQGEDLSDLAVEFSLCPSKESGGMLGWVQRGQMVPEFEQAAFAAPLNKVVRCKTQYGWHLIQVLSEREASSVLDVGPEELHSKMQDPSFFEEAQLIDVREPDEIEQASLPGFKILPLRQFGTWGPEITNSFDPQKDTYVLCHHGMRSMQVAQWLQSQGFKRVFNIAGGIHAYAIRADSSVPTY